MGSPRVIGVTGSRHGASAVNLKKLRVLLTALDPGQFHCGARGFSDDRCKTDAKAAVIAADLGFEVVFHPPNLARYGSPAAFHVRIAALVLALVPDGLLVAFPGGRGTRSTVGVAERRGVEVINIEGCSL